MGFALKDGLDLFTIAYFLYIFFSLTYAFSFRAGRMESATAVITIGNLLSEINIAIAIH